MRPSQRLSVAVGVKLWWQASCPRMNRRPITTPAATPASSLRPRRVRQQRGGHAGAEQQHVDPSVSASARAVLRAVIGASQARISLRWGRGRIERQGRGNGFGGGLHETDGKR